MLLTSATSSSPARSFCRKLFRVASPDESGYQVLTAAYDSADREPLVWLPANIPDAQVIRETAGPATEALREETATRIARIRATPEAREGVGAFFDKRDPDWNAVEEAEIHG